MGSDYFATSETASATKPTQMKKMPRMMNFICSDTWSGSGFESDHQLRSKILSELSPAIAPKIMTPPQLRALRAVPKPMRAKPPERTARMAEWEGTREWYRRGGRMTAGRRKLGHERGAISPQAVGRHARVA